MRAEENKEREWNEELNRALKASEQSEKRRQEALEAQIAEDIRQFERVEQARKTRVMAHYLELCHRMHSLHKHQRQALVRRQEAEESTPNVLQRIEQEEKELAVSIAISHTNAREVLENELRDRRQRWADEFLETMTRHNSAQSKLIGIFWEEILLTHSAPTTHVSEQLEESDDNVSEDSPPLSVDSPTSKDLTQRTDLSPPASDPTHILDAAEHLQLRLKALTEAQHCEKTALRECLARDEEKIKARIARTRPSQELLERRDVLARERREAEKEVEESGERFRAERMWFNLLLRERGEMLRAEERRVLESGREVN